MNSLEWFARDRIQQFRQQHKAIEGSDSLTQSAVAGLAAIGIEIGKLDSLLNEVRDVGDGSSDDPALVQACITVNQKLSSLTAYLGIILRSTNTRNSFEAYYALNEIATLYAGNDERLVISSEWEYSPFYIPRPPDALREFVFIGFPAYLSRNSLLVPLAAHELGHAIWRIRSMEGSVYTQLDYYARQYVEENRGEIRSVLGLEEDLFADTLLSDFLGEVLELAVTQAEEVFCDCFGTALFRESYVYAFNSFVLPGFGSRVSLGYPALHNRVDYIKRCGAQLNLAIRDAPSPPSEGLTAKRPASEIADHVVADAFPAISVKAIAFAGEMKYSDGENALQISKNFRNKVPALRPASPVQILLAAWDVYLDWQGNETNDSVRHENFRIMNNLCLKSLETYEISRASPLR